MKKMLCCNAGMSTSLLVQKMQAELQTVVWILRSRLVHERAHDRLSECDMLLRSADRLPKGDFEGGRRSFPGRGHQHGRLRPHERCRHHRPLRQRDGLGAPRRI